MDKNLNTIDKSFFKGLFTNVKARLAQIDSEQSEINERIKELKDEYENIQSSKLENDKTQVIDTNYASEIQSAKNDLFELDHEKIEVEAIQKEFERNVGLNDPEIEEVKKALENKNLQQEIWKYRDMIALDRKCTTTCTKCITDCIKCVTDCTRCITDCVRCVSDCATGSIIGCRIRMTPI